VRGAFHKTYDVEYEGAAWKVAIRLKTTEDGDLPSSGEKDFTEQLPE
jgi:hypothetical protein